MASLGSLSAIARQRPAFMSTVVQAFESLHGKATTCLTLHCYIKHICTLFRIIDSVAYNVVRFVTTEHEVCWGHDD